MKSYVDQLSEPYETSITLEVMAMALELEVIEQRHAFMNEKYLQRYPSHALEAKVKRGKEIKAAAVFIRRMIAEGKTA